MAINIVGGMTAADREAELNKPKQEEGFGSLLMRGLNVGNAAKAIYDNISRDLETGGYDPTFNAADHWEELTKGLPSRYHDRLAKAENMEHALAIKEGIKSDIHDMEVLGDNGFTGIAATMAAGLVDIDMLLPAAKAAQIGRTTTRAARLAKAAETAKVAAMSAGVTESALAATGDTNEWVDVPVGILTATVFGAALGSTNIASSRPGLTIQRVDDEFIDAAKAARIGAAPADEFEQAMEARRWTAFQATPDSLHRAAQSLAEIADDPNYSKALDNTADVMSDYTGARVFGNEWDEAGTTLAERAAILDGQVKPLESTTKGFLGAFNKVLNFGPLQDTWTALTTSGSPVARALAISLLESAEGIVVNNRSAAMVKELIFNHSYKNFAEGWADIVREGRAALGIGMFDFKGKAQYEADLGRNVIMAANDLRLGRSIDGYDDDVRKALDHINKMSEFIRNEARGGHGGARAVPGFENVKAQKAYIPLQWSGEKLRQAIAKYGRKRIEAALRSAYLTANPDMGADTAGLVSRALIRRAETKGTTIDTNLDALLAGDGKDFLRQALVDNGVAEQAADDVLSRLAVKDVDKGKVAYARRRTDIDLAGTYEGIRIIDLADTDLNSLMFRYSDSMSKRIALSRHGIDSAGQIETIKNRIMQEVAEGGKKDSEQLAKYRELLDHTFRHFEPGSLDQNVDINVRRAKQATNLSLLGKLGITQGAEIAATMATAGIQNVIASSGVMQKFLRGMNRKQVLDDLGWMVGNLGYERGLLQSSEVADMALDAVQGSTTIAKEVDKALARGQRVQGFLSGYTAVMEAQLNMASLAVSNKIFRGLRNGEDLSALTRGIGLTEQTVAKLRGLIDNGTVQFLDNGHLDRLNPDTWPTRLREEFGLALTRNARQNVQRAMAGEEMPWMHSTTGALFSHLITFPLLSMRKQFARTIAKDDGSFTSLTLYGLATAALAGAVRNFTEGKEQTAESIARASLSMSNSIGWTTLGIDPTMALLGLSEYAPGGKYSGEFTLPMLSTASTALGIPTAVGHALTGEFTKTDKRAMQVVPVVGSMYGMGRLLNTLVKDEE